MVGPLAGPLLSLLELAPDSTPSLLARISEAHFMWAVGAVSLPQEERPPARRWFRDFLLQSRTSSSSDPRVVPAEGPFSALRWSSLHPRPAPNHSWTEVMAAGIPVSAAVVAFALGQIFEETASIDRYNAAVGQRPDKVLFRFADRAFASGFSPVIPCLDLDQSVSAKGSRHWAAPPRKRIAAAQDALAGGPAPGADPRLVRPSEALAREAGLRSAAGSVMGGWRSYQSGLRCWSAFMDACFPADPHFPARAHHVHAFAPFFQNGDTFAKYLSHVHFGERLLQLDRGVSRDLENAAIRGASKFRAPRGGSAFHQGTVVSLVEAALAVGRTDLARLMVVARTWLLRVPSEGIPLQCSGRVGLREEDPGWHSFVTVVRAAPRPVVRITWHRRKNEPSGHSMERSCTCGPSPSSSLLCGPCALLGQLADARKAGHHPASPLFPRLQGNRGREAFRAITATVGVRPEWHAFRRGMALDMLAGGSPLGEILLAGGWRSGAFLRYLTRFDIDRRVALEHAMVESEGDEA